jgi:hypothetical protein
MAQNLWKLGGQPTSFNPLSVTVYGIPVPIGSYTVNVKARSASGRTLKCWVSPQEFSSVGMVTLTPTATVYTFNKTVLSTNQNIQMCDGVGAGGDIIIDSIEVVKQALPALPTLHNLSRSRRVGALTAETSFTDEKILSLSKVSVNGNPATKQSAATIKANFDGKVSGSTDLIPHASKRTSNTTLVAPSAFTTELDTTMYSQIRQTDGTVFSQSHAFNANMDMMLYSFDLIRLMTDKFGSEFFADSPLLTDKVTKLKNLLTRIQADWWGYGSTVLSNYAQSTDFAGKLQGSTVENPNKAATNWSTALQVPSVTQWDWNNTEYTAVSTQNGALESATNTTNGQMSQHRFSFDLIEYVKRKYNFTPDVAWLKANVTKLTANWWGFGTNAQANPSGIANFVSKVAGSVVENPHISKVAASGALGAPSTYGTEATQSWYNAMSAQDGTTTGTGIVATSSGGMATQLFSFNLIEYVQRKYSVTIPGADTAAKVQWLKDNVTNVQLNWWGYGTSAGGYKANLAQWYVNGSSWTTPIVSGATGVSKVSTSRPNPGIDRIDANGFLYYLAYADPSDGVTASTITTDYVELAVDLKPGGNKATVSRWNDSTSSWIAGASDFHTNGTVTKVSPGIAVGGAVTPTSAIDANGFAHFLAYADPSNGISPSVINTDYISLDVEVVAGSNKTTLAKYDPTASSWGNNVTHTAGTVTKLTNIGSAGFTVDANGMVHFLAYADPSNGVTPSTINTDYIELTVDVNLAEAGYDVYVDSDTTHQLPKLLDNMIDAGQASPVDVNVYNGQLSSATGEIQTVGGRSALGVIPSGSSSDTFISRTYSIAVGDALTIMVDMYVPSATGLSPAIGSRGLRIVVYPYNSVSATYGALVQSAQVADVDKWATVFTTFVLPSGYDQAQIRIYNGNQDVTKKVYYTNFKVEKGSNPNPTWTPGRNKKKTLNFLGKVAGSADSVPHQARKGNYSAIPIPSSMMGLPEEPQSTYDFIGKQEGTTLVRSNGTVGGSAYHIFEFDLSHLGLSLADLKSALRKLTVTWVGWGRGDSAGVQTNGATVKVWSGGAGTPAWGYDTLNTASTPTMVTRTLSTTDDEYYIDNNQKVYVLAHSTYPASATYTSDICTDYVRLDIELADWVDYVKTNGVKLKISDPTKVKLAFPNTRDVIDIDYVKNDPRTYPKKNMVPPFTDSRWFSSLATSSPVTDRDIDVTSTSAGGGTLIYIPVENGKTYTLASDAVTGGNVNVYRSKSISGADWLGRAPKTITVDSSYAGFVTIKLENVGIGTVRYSKLVLVEGSTAIPWEPYQLIGGFRNVIASRKVPKKNLFDGILEQGDIDGTTGIPKADNTKVRSKNFCKIDGGRNYIASRDSVISYFYILEYDSNFQFIKYTGAFNVATKTFTTANNTCWFKLIDSANVLSAKIQIEEGSAASTYEDYKLLDAKPSKPGMMMDGYSSLLQLPSMTMDAIEVDFLFDTNQPNSFYALLDARTGLASGFYFSDSIGSPWTSIIINGVDKSSSRVWADVPKGVRTKVKLGTASAFTDDVTIFGDSASARKAKGVIYGIKCYLNGQVIKEYDATDLAALTGGKLLPKYNDLVPDFSSSSWAFHANALVYGKEWLKLNATASNQTSSVDVTVLASTNYQFKVNAGAYDVLLLDASNNTLSQPITGGTSGTFTTQPTAVKARFVTKNTAAGTFEFGKPQLYKTDGTEAQIIGNPLPKIKTPRRVLDRIR